MQQSPKFAEIEWWGKGIIIILFMLPLFGGAWIIYGFVAAIESSSWWQERKACAEWHESFPDRRLIEIVRKEVDGQSFDQIGDFYGVSGGCVEKRVDEDRELFDRLKALHIVENE